MEIDFVKCESERPRSETCGAKSEAGRSASFPSNRRPRPVATQMAEPSRKGSSRPAPRHSEQARRPHQKCFHSEASSCHPATSYGEVSLKPLQALVINGFGDIPAILLPDLPRWGSAWAFCFNQHRCFQSLLGAATMLRG